MPPAPFYRRAIALLGVGAGWVSVSATGVVTFTPCLVKHLTGYPCPTCGATRAVVAFLRGDVAAAFGLNPLGPVAVVVASLVVLLLAYDLLTRRALLPDVSRWAIAQVARPVVFAPLGLAMVMNWAWNIQKGL